jgi:hypothetical protein
MKEPEPMPRHRKLTGIAPWPMILLAGPEKVGKTWSAVEACMSELVAGGYWFPFGENDPDEYALIPGFSHDRFTLVRNDGTYRDLLASLDEELAAEKGRTEPTMWVLDSGTRAWDLLSNMAQLEMYERQRRKAEYARAKGRDVPPPDPEQKPSVDLWNIAADRWSHIVDAFRKHHGPVIITARMELKTIMQNGEPTKEKEQKILAHKSLPSDVDAIVELSAPGQAVVTGVRSVKLAGLDKRAEYKGFTVDKFLRALGVDKAVGDRSHSGIDAEDKPATEAEAARGELRALCEANGWDMTAVAAEFEKCEGVAVKVASAKVIRDYIAAKKPPQDERLPLAGGAA